MNGLSVGPGRHRLPGQVSISCGDQGEFAAYARARCRVSCCTSWLRRCSSGKSRATTRPRRLSGDCASGLQNLFKDPAAAWKNSGPAEMRGLFLGAAGRVGLIGGILRRKALTPRGAIIRWGWQAGDITIQRVMHDKLTGPVIWDARRRR